MNITYVSPKTNVYRHVWSDCSSVRTSQNLFTFYGKLLYIYSTVETFLASYASRSTQLTHMAT